ncbi:hypothetical protein JOD64_005485 [Micromonospora luteifusca]|uniref:Uncharacterized protein n=1 Tax=Micromonospora luteifusca TaxID=709860 RepID=A0ABS2M1E2_9ACTN|nr:hypothetical protein [Micromonospora luteifusca]MBM7494263.1 hypothetical protein [Micromonospora luteifusca]
MKACRLVVAAFLVCLVTSGCGLGQFTTAEGTSTTYTCCDATDVDTVYQPGQNIILQWIVMPGTAPAAKSPQVELTARLTGPYADPSELKNATTGKVRPASKEATFQAPPVRPSGAADERPSSVIPIAEDALPGYYNLIFAIREGDGSVSGASIVLVASKT